LLRCRCTIHPFDTYVKGHTSLRRISEAAFQHTTYSRNSLLTYIVTTNSISYPKQSFNTQHISSQTAFHHTTYSQNSLSTHNTHTRNSLSTHNTYPKQPFNTHTTHTRNCLSTTHTLNSLFDTYPKKPLYRACVEGMYSVSGHTLHCKTLHRTLHLQGLTTMVHNLAMRSHSCSNTLPVSIK